MKKYILIVLILFTYSVNAQWTKISSQSVGIAGKTHVYNSVLFLYGTTNQFNVYRSDNNGQTWSNIANKFPYDVYYMFNHKNEIFAVTTTLGQGIYRFYTSKDEGITWSEKSNIQNITGNGAILFMTSDGIKLYAVSNRKSYYTSLDDGATWKETIINTTAAGNMIYFASAGNTMVSIVLGTGAVVSVDGGITWNVINVTNPALQIMYVINFNGSIYGYSSGSGVYKFNASTKVWDTMSKGLPDALSFQISKILSHLGNTIYFATVGFLDSKPLFFYSNDGGANWSSLSTNGLTTISSATATSSFAVNAQNIFLYDYKNTTNEASLYRLTNNTTSIRQPNSIPNEFTLNQNYPNPFNPSTVISYKLQAASHITLKVYNVLGNEVATLVNEFQQAGSYNSQFSIQHSPLSSGVYFYTLKANGFSLTKKMILMK